MARPRIGISLDTNKPGEPRKRYELAADYADAIFRAGGLPMPLPHTTDGQIIREMLDSVDGLLFPGGADCHPHLYGQELAPATHLMDPLRQSFDLAMLALAEQHNMPTLGICLGCQLMNVQRSGTLHQSLPEAMPESPIRHSQPGNHTNFHDVQLQKGSKLGEIVGLGTLQVNSRHRQGVAKLGRGLMASALAPDGLLEAVEDPSLTFWIAVQWHPENLPGTPHDKLFAALVEAAKMNKKS